MKAFLMAAGAAMLLGGCQSMAPADDRMAAGAPAMSEAAMRYMQMAHSSDMFEIESSRLALQMSQNPVVRSFAQMMIDDHTRLMNEMMSMTGGQMPASMQMMPHHMEMLQRLRSIPPQAFDMAYHREQVMAHQEAVNLHRTYAATGDNPMLRDMASRAAPVVQMHLDQLSMHNFMPQTMQPMEPMPVQNQPRRAGERG